MCQIKVFSKEMTIYMNIWFSEIKYLCKLCDDRDIDGMMCLFYLGILVPSRMREVLVLMNK